LECRDARRDGTTGTLVTPTEPLGGASGSLVTPSGTPRRPSRPLPMPRRRLAISRRRLLAPWRDFAASGRHRLERRLPLVTTREPLRTQTHAPAASRGTLPTPRRSLGPSRGPVAASRCPPLVLRGPVPPPQRRLGPRRGHGPSPPRHLGAPRGTQLLPAGLATPFRLTLPPPCTYRIASRRDLRGGGPGA